MIYTTVVVPPFIAPLVSLRKLEHLVGYPRAELFRIAERAGAYYKPFDRRREAGTGKWRHIDNPEGELKPLQRNIQRRILNRIPLPECMYGAVPGRSVLGNARVHVGQPIVATLDLRNCFPMTRHSTVFGVFRSLLRCSEEIADLLTKLTTFQGRLPQGAPTSPALCNLALLPLVEDVVAIAVERGLRATFFVDDITLSGTGAEEAIESIIKVAAAHGFAVGRKKTKVMRVNRQQMVTGVLVNRHPSIPREYREELRYRILELEDMENPPETDLRQVRGRIAWVRSTWPAYGQSLEDFARDHLPAAGPPGKRARTDETRPCTHVRRHRFKVRTASSASVVSP